MSVVDKKIQEQVLNSKVVTDPPIGTIHDEPKVPPLTLKIPDTGYPPQVIPPHEPYLSEPYPPLSLNYSPMPQDNQHNQNYVATGAKPESQPSMHNEEGWTKEKSSPISTQGLNIDPNSIIFEPPMLNETEFSDEIDQQRDKYLHLDKEKSPAPEIHIHLELSDPEPDEFTFSETMEDWKEAISGSPRFDAFTNTSSFVGNVRYDRYAQAMTMILNGKSYDFCRVSEREYQALKGASSVGKAFNDTIKGQHDCSGGADSVRTPLMIQESIGQIRNEFKWLSDDYLDRVRKVKSDGKWYLIRASAETITDHRSEGEEYRRKLDGDELHAMARTAISHGMDINHLGEDFKTKALIADAEYDKERKEIQMLVHESDAEIIDGIRNHEITAVSINGGAPRSTKVECEQSECFNVPRGVVLGELDGIALTWVVTTRNGFRWRNKHIPYAKPGVGTTVIEPLN